jgi:hypothetical protein
VETRTNSGDIARDAGLFLSTVDLDVRVLRLHGVRSYPSHIRQPRRPIGRERVFGYHLDAEGDLRLCRVTSEGRFAEQSSKNELEPTESDQCNLSICTHSDEDSKNLLDVNVSRCVIRGPLRESSAAPHNNPPPRPTAATPPPSLQEAPPCGPPRAQRVPPVRAVTWRVSR